MSVYVCEVLCVCACNQERCLFVYECENRGVSVRTHAWDKNVKNLADPHDFGQNGLSLCWSKVISSLWKIYFSPILSKLYVFYYTTPPLFAMQSAKENITLGVLMGTFSCSF